MAGTSIRRATDADLTDIRRLITDAYTKYIERIGRSPAPMTADYAAALEHSRVWVLQSDDATENLSFYPRHGYRETGRALQDGFRRVYFSKAVRPDNNGG